MFGYKHFVENYGGPMSPQDEYYTAFVQPVLVLIGGLLIGFGVGHFIGESRAQSAVNQAYDAVVFTSKTIDEMNGDL
jgi:hypothetical protein